MLKPSLQLRLRQQLAMAPQLQQAIRLLQLSSLELRTEIQQVYESNPMLEMGDGQAGAQENGETASDDVGTSEIDTEYQMDGDRDREISDQDFDEFSMDWHDVSSSSTWDGDSSRPNFFLENQASSTISLQEHLLWQLYLLPLTEPDRIIATNIIDAIDDDGYLIETLEEIHANLPNQATTDLEEVHAVLTLVQHLDPIGAGSRNIAECLNLQLQQKTATTPYFTEAQLIINQYLNYVASRDIKSLCKVTGLAADKIEQIITLIQSLNPKPGANLHASPPEYIVPDVHVVKTKGQWAVELNHRVAPQLRINSVYANLVQRANSSEENNYLRNQLQEAKWFIKSLRSRNETLLQVAKAIVNHQRAFLDYGEEAMKPLVLRDIAEELSMHESTISRVTVNKFMDTPRGIFEFKYFFSSHVGTSDGGACSSTAIRAMIKKLIEEEDVKKPLSDHKIASLLTAKGINVARRTVAKYREALSIPPSHERKQPLSN